MTRQRLAVWCAFLASVMGCAVTNRTEQSFGARPTLVTWPGSEKPVEDTTEGMGDLKQGGRGADTESAPQDQPDPIVTERPDFTNSSRTVGKQRVQFEGGYTFTTDRNGNTRSVSHSAPEALLRVGLAADWFELQVGLNALSTRQREDTEADRSNGVQDLYLAAKFALTRQAGILPETAVTAQLSLPTGSSELSAGRVLPGLLYLYSWELVPDRLSLGGSSVATRAVEDDRGYLLLAQSASLSYTLTPRLGAYTEAFGLFASEAPAGTTGPQYYFNGGFLFRVTANFQLDLRAGLGLNRQADDFFGGIGCALRY